ncbi:TetR/AcrR family transcriptional regulator [Herbaspirillum sp. GCM10030257]|uniref:TetR/AcrR family transcriptional regulator n=1 Tax=Herbaspirillum sp. GCM10030257 TaxID=3273393 RepID=UPI00361FA35E
MKNDPIGDARQHREMILEEVHDQKRERILAVAEELFFQRGYAGTTMSDIVEQLGVAKPYLYYYFSNKAEIYETLTLRSSHACLTAMHFDASDTRPAVEKLREGLQRFATANVLYFKSGTFAYRESATRHPEVDRKVRNLARKFYKELRSLLEEGREDGDIDFEDAKLTAFAIGSIAGFLYTWYKPDGAISPEDMAAQLTSILLRIAGDRQRTTRARRRSCPR